MKKTIESRTASTILQKSNTVKIGDESFDVAPPSTATLILVSEAISQLPDIKPDPENMVLECLYVAKESAILGDILAILILGAKGLKKKVIKKRFFGLIKEEVEVDCMAPLSKKILEDLTPQQVNELITTALSGMQLAFFFATITSLIEVNILRKTKSETTASGQ
jgi:hypothetical protein